MKFSREHCFNVETTLFLLGRYVGDYLIYKIYHTYPLAAAAAAGICRNERWFCVCPQGLTYTYLYSVMYGFVKVVTYCNKDDAYV